jgi:hypothetical protein
MRIMTVALGTALVLNLGTYSAAAHSQKAKVVREPRAIIRVPKPLNDLGGCRGNGTHRRPLP